MLCLLITVLWLSVPSLAVARAPRPWLQGGQGRIINGTPANISDHPWQLSMESWGSHVCGASIISERWALTAAHCVTTGRVANVNLRAGSSIRGSGGVLLQSTSVVPHQQYDPLTIDYDIAVVQAVEPFPLGSNVQIVRLPSDGYDPPEGLAVTVTGWGQTEAGPLPYHLLKVDVSIVARDTCRQLYVDVAPVTERMVCAGLPDRGVCRGDSGGPLVSGNLQVGVVSWGDIDCRAPMSAYSSVGNLRQWIRSNTGV